MSQPEDELEKFKINSLSPDPSYKYIPSKVFPPVHVKRLSRVFDKKPEALTLRGFDGYYKRAKHPNDWIGGGKGFRSVAQEFQPDPDAYLLYDGRISEKRLLALCEQNFEISNPNCLILSARAVEEILKCGPVSEDHFIKLPVRRRGFDNELGFMYAFDPPIGPPVFDFVHSVCEIRTDLKTSMYWISPTLLSDYSVYQDVEFCICRDANKKNQMFITKELSERIFGTSSQF